jgi:hypothetical protein
MIASFPEEWRNSPTFEANRRFAIVCGLFAWYGFAAVVVGDVLLRATAAAVLPGLDVIAVCVLLCASISFRVYRAVSRFRERAVQGSIAALSLLPLLHVLMGSAAGVVVVWTVGTGAWILILVVAGEVIQVLAVGAHAALLDLANYRFAPGSPLRLGIAHAIRADARRAGIARRFAVMVLRPTAWTSAAVAFVLYGVWALPIMFGTRLVRVITEPRSFLCRAQNCYSVFDDPELACSCGRGQFHNFPRLRRPWLAICSHCRQSIGVWQPTTALLASGLAAFSFRWCPDCRNAVPRRGHLMIVPIDGAPAARFAQAARQAGLDVTMVPADRVIWAGDADVVLFAVEDGARRESDARFALHSVGLPHAEGSWGDTTADQPRGWFKRLFMPPRRPQVSRRRRRMPPLAMLGAPGTESVPRWIHDDGRGLAELLREVR